MIDGNKKQSALLLFVLLAILFSQVIFFIYNKIKTKEQNTMFKFNEVEYPVEYANYQRNSHISVSARAQGRLLWAKELEGQRKDYVLMPRTVLIRQDIIGIVSTENLLIYKSNGLFQYMLPIGFSTPVVFGNKAIAYIIPAYLLNYQYYSRKLILEAGEFPSLKQWAYVLLFKPENYDFIAAVQFTGGPMRQPAMFDIYRKQIEKSWVRLSYSGEGHIDFAMLTTDDKTLVVLQGGKVHLLETVNIKIESSFGLEFEEINSASLDDKNNLVIIGRGAKKGLQPYLSKLSLSGKLLWEYQLHDPQTHQPPASGNSGQIYAVDAGQLNCINNGILEWKYPLKNNNKVWLTVTKDDSVVLLQGNELSLIDESGNEIFSVQVTKDDEHFDAPPAVDARGRIYVASDKKLYCFE